MRIEEEYNAILFLKVNYETGEASVASICDQEVFDDQSTLWKMDILQDIIHDVTQMYEAEGKKMRKEHDLETNYKYFIGKIKKAQLAKRRIK